MNSYELSRSWFDWCFENPERIKPNHTALYFFCIEHCNRLGWKEKFGLPTTMVMEGIGIKSYNTYIKTLNEIVDFGFIILIEKSKNQYSANIIALSKNDKAHTKALDKALIKHGTKQLQSTEQSIDSINKQETINNTTNKQVNRFQFLLDSFELFKDYFKTEFISISDEDLDKEIKSFIMQKEVATDINKDDHEYKAHFMNVIKKNYKNNHLTTQTSINTDDIIVDDATERVLKEMYNPDGTLKRKK